LQVWKLEGGRADSDKFDEGFIGHKHGYSAILMYDFQQYTNTNIVSSSVVHGVKLLHHLIGPSL